MLLKAKPAVELLTLKEVAARLRVSVRTVRRLTAYGALPTIRASARRVCVPSAAVDDYIARGGWQSENARAVGFVSRYKWAGDAYLKDCQRSPPKPRRKLSLA
jgi:excisionase family DNA binding protein